MRSRPGSRVGPPLGRVVAHRLATTQGSQLAFRNPDGSTILLLANPDDALRILALGARQTTVTGPAHSFNIFRWQPWGLADLFF